MRTTPNRRDDAGLARRSFKQAAETARTSSREDLLAHFQRVRAASVEMCRPLTAETYRIQPAEEVSPPWWNLGHTSWHYVRAALEPFGGRREPEDDEFDFVLNSYYAVFGERLARGRRGSLSKPTTEEIYAYRASVDRRVEELLMQISEERLDELAFRLVVGMNHEQQHQELFYTEIKNILAQNPPSLRAAYLPSDASENTGGLPDPLRFLEFSGGLSEFGHAGPEWCWDNELPRHKHFLAPFALADRLTTNGEFLAFIEDGGYQRQLLWLDNGWNAACEQAWKAPLYWERVDGEWHNWTLAGLRPLAMDEPACHLSFYEADAFTRWRSETFADEGSVRLPTEREWEHAARRMECQADAGAFLDLGRLHPRPATGTAPLRQMFGVAWQWTASYYEPYPGYQSFAGDLAEYNGKFMDNQRVLRGGSCATPQDHFRVTYRNFWPAVTRFQFTGLRLARN
jgi:ergothioneine biosynthesis protein EgtB